MKTLVKALYQPMRLRQADDVARPLPLAQIDKVDDNLKVDGYHNSPLSKPALPALPYTETKVTSRQLR